MKKTFLDSGSLLAHYRADFRGTVLVQLRDFLTKDLLTEILLSKRPRPGPIIFSENQAHTKHEGVAKSARPFFFKMTQYCPK